MQENKKENKPENKQENKPYEKAREWAALLCRYADEDDAFCRDFWQRLTRSEGVFGEFVYYLEHRDFRCGYKVAGYSVIDIMVWQMDHFKARLDRGGDGMKAPDGTESAEICGADAERDGDGLSGKILDAG